MDITGRVMNEQRVHNSATCFMNISSYLPGMYIYQVVTNGKTWSGKIVIEQ
jgi:hypothetical protein